MGLVAVARQTWRRLIAWMGPEWLVADELVVNGEKVQTDSRVLYPVMTMFDVMSERVRLGMRAGLPGLAPEDALAYIEPDIIRGPTEPRASYEARLIRSIDDKRVAGLVWALLEQIRGYCTPHAVRVRLVNEHGTFFTIDRDGTRSIHRASAWEWDGAVPSAKTWTTTVTVNQAGKTYTRSAGSFLDDGFKVGMGVHWSGFKDHASNGPKTIAAGLSAQVMTVAEAVGANEAGARHTTCVGPNVIGGKPRFGRRIPWSRFWVLIYPTTGAPKQPWDRDGTWGDGELWATSTTGTWGSTATTGDVQAIRTICTRWKSLGFHCMNIAIVFNDAAFAPADTAPPLPDGTWANDGKYERATPGRKTRARSTDAIYWNGSS